MKSETVRKNALRVFLSLCLFSVLSLNTSVFANESFLPPDQAFQFSAESIDGQNAQLKWSIAPHYYLYHDQFKVTVNNTPIKLKLPAGHEKDDPTFGVTNVHYNQVLTQIAVKPNANYKVSWQGCSEDGLCYPLQHKTIQSDADGLFPQQATQQRGGLLSLNQSTNKKIITTPATAQDDAVATPEKNLEQKNVLKPETPVQSSAASEVDETAVSSGMNDAIPSSTVNAANTVITTDITTESNTKNIQPKPTTSLQLNDDQAFLKLLSQDSLFLNLLVFFLLGILLAFLPCSLPLIPILSGILVQRATGYKTIAIALSFVISMALVYSIMGIVVAEIGYSFQRIFQSPIIISIFAIMFVALALNLFGLYQINLPQGLMNKLGKLQDKQQGGTIIGAGFMGALSALIVGPCMSAPLAGALLFVSQSHNAFLGGLYLFILGLGIGLPLFVASVFGSRWLPKPGMWMDRVKVAFGFLMLMLAVYFIRPMLPSTIYFALLALLCLALGMYLIVNLRQVIQASHKALLLAVVAICLIASGWNIRESIQAYQVQHSDATHLEWTKVTTQAELKQALIQASALNRPIIIDTYADWCVACQPIEKEVFPRTDVQSALKDFTLIKLDLTNYNESQDLILKEWEILGPPTLLILQADGAEQRALRLTGTFSAEKLIKQLKSAQKN